MKATLSKIVFILFVLFGLFVSFSIPSRAGFFDSKQNIVVKLDHFSDDLHSVYMGLSIAVGLLQKGQVVTLFANMEAVRLVDKRQPLNLRWGSKEKTLAELYDMFVKHGGQIVVCPSCAQVIGLTKDELRPSAHFATEGEIPDMLILAQKVIDY